MEYYFRKLDDGRWQRREARKGSRWHTLTFVTRSKKVRLNDRLTREVASKEWTWVPEKS